MPHKKLLDSVQFSVDQALALVPMLSEERKSNLEKLVNFISSKAQNHEPIELITICTHNSRRSHLGQVWSAVMAHHFKIPNVQAFSGGTEATACHPNTISALKAQGFIVLTQSNSSAHNPVYEIHYANDQDPILCWSKKFNDTANPQKDFAAIMVCGSADGACPIVAGCSLRLAHTYIDPKASDGTPAQDAVYQARSLQIGAEFGYVMSRSAEILKSSSIS